MDKKRLLEIFIFTNSKQNDHLVADGSRFSLELRVQKDTKMWKIVYIIHITHW